jgi:hypothetical protein
MHFRPAEDPRISVAAGFNASSIQHSTFLEDNKGTWRQGLASLAIRSDLPVTNFDCARQSKRPCIHLSALAGLPGGERAWQLPHGPTRQPRIMTISSSGAGYVALRYQPEPDDPLTFFDVRASADVSSCT